MNYSSTDYLKLRWRTSGSPAMERFPGSFEVLMG
jgi:hypothetical protein